MLELTLNDIKMSFMVGFVKTSFQHMHCYGSMRCKVMFRRGIYTSWTYFIICENWCQSFHVNYERPIMMLFAHWCCIQLLYTSVRSHLHHLKHSVSSVFNVLILKSSKSKSCLFDAICLLMLYTATVYVCQLLPAPVEELRIFCCQYIDII